MKKIFKVFMGIVVSLIVIAVIGVVAICIVKTGRFGGGNWGDNEMRAEATQLPAVESVVASATNPTKEPAYNADFSQQPTEVPVQNPPMTTNVPTASAGSEQKPENTKAPLEATSAPVVTQAPLNTAVPAVTAKPAATAAPTATPVTAPTQAPQVVTGGLTDADITYVAELLEVTEDEVRLVIEKATEAGYDLSPDAVLNGEVNIMEAWDIVKEVFGKKRAYELLLKVMKLGIF